MISARPFSARVSGWGEGQEGAFLLSAQCQQRLHRGRIERHEPCTAIGLGPAQAVGVQAHAGARRGCGRQQPGPQRLGGGFAGAGGQALSAAARQFVDALQQALMGGVHARSGQQGRQCSRGGLSTAGGAHTACRHLVA